MENTLIQSKCRALNLIDIVVLSPLGFPKEGDVFLDGTIYHFYRGKIHSKSRNIPAIECSDGHLEYWNMGKPGRKDGFPTIISHNGKYVEFWEDGKFIKADVIKFS